MVGSASTPRNLAISKCTPTFLADISTETDTFGNLLCIHWHLSVPDMLPMNLLISILTFNSLKHSCIFLISAPILIIQSGSVSSKYLCTSSLHLKILTNQILLLHFSFCSLQKYKTLCDGIITHKCGR